MFKNLILKIVRTFIIVVFITETSLSLVSAQSAFYLPIPGEMIGLSAVYQPASLVGMKLFPDQPLKFDFIIDPGDSGLDNVALKDETQKLIKYFLTALTVNEKDLWVNLSPQEKDRIIPNEFGITEMGRDLLGQDYILKQVTASLMYPDAEMGKRFWDKIYQEANKKYGHPVEIPVNTFNKVWILPDQASVYENGNLVMVVDSHLKVMLEEEYLKGQGLGDKDQELNIQSQADPRYTAIVKEIILPEIEKEINQGKNFAPLRQIYNSLILATWYKRNLKQSLLGQIYVGKDKVEGVEVEDKAVKEKIYEQYLEAFQKGSYNLIKEEYDSATQEIIQKKYFSGGAEMTKVNVDSAPGKEALRKFRGKNLQTASTDFAVLGTKDGIATQEFQNRSGVSRPGWMRGIDSDDVDEIRREMFGEGVGDWLNIMETSEGNKEVKNLAVEKISQDLEFIAELSNDNIDPGIEIIRYVVLRNINLGTRSFADVIQALKKVLPNDVRDKILIKNLPYRVYVESVIRLAKRSTQEYFDSEQFVNQSDDQKLDDLIAYIFEEIPSAASLRIRYLKNYLPSQLSTKTARSDIKRSTEVSLELYLIMKRFLKIPRIKAYVYSPEFYRFETASRIDQLYMLMKQEGFDVPEDKNELFFALPYQLRLLIKSRPGVAVRKLKELEDRAILGDEDKIISPARDIDKEEVGGIDLNPTGLDIQSQGQKIKFITPPDLKYLETTPIKGFTPVIYQMTPVTNIPLLLGINESGLSLSVTL